MRAVLRWVATNLPNMALALILSLLAWLGAVEAQDPTRTGRYPQPIRVTVLGLEEDMVLVGGFEQSVRVEIRAAQSVWQALTPEDFSANVDLSGLGVGKHQVPVRVAVRKQPTRVIQVDPSYVTVQLDVRAQRTVPVRVNLAGEPALGYLQRTPSITPREVNVDGPEQYVAQVAEAMAEVSIQDVSSDVEGKFPLRLLDRAGATVPYVVASPDMVEVRVPIELSSYYRPLPVKVVITGQVAADYRISGISVDPPIVTIFGPPDIIAALPGYVETEPIDVEGAVADVVERPRLALPQNTSVVLGQQPILVRVLVEPIQSSRTVQVTPTLQGLGPGLTATVPLQTFEVILSGPLPLLQKLEADDVRVVLDLFGLPVGKHQIAPHVVVPEGIVAQNVLPAALQIEILPVSRLTPMPTPPLMTPVPLTATPNRP